MKFQQDLVREEWLPVVGWERHYQVSDLGRVMSITRTLLMANGQYRTYSEKLLALTPHPRDLHLYCMLHNPRRNCRVHQLVMRAFVGECPEGMEVRHLNGNHADNRRVNLQYGTRLENNLDTVKHGRHITASALRCKRNHMFIGANIKHLAGNRRGCLACTLAWPEAQKYRDTTQYEQHYKAAADLHYFKIMCGIAL